MFFCHSESFRGHISLLHFHKACLFTFSFKSCLNKGLKDCTSGVVTPDFHFKEATFCMVLCINMLDIKDI